MAKLIVKRFKQTKTATFSKIYLDEEFICFGLENIYRSEKIAGKTRIPAGTYNIRVRTWGGFHAKYSERFSDFHRGMLEIMHVPNFTHILIHIGNRAKDTDGCLLVGRGRSISEEVLYDSARAYELLYKKAINHALNSDLTIEIIDEANHNPELLAA